MFGFPTIESEWNLLVDSFAKSNVPIEQIFLEPWVPKKWLLDSIYYQNYYDLREKDILKFLKKIWNTMSFLV